MNTNTITFAGIIIALFISISLLFNVDVRAVQVYMEIPKIIAIAIGISNIISRKNQIFFLIACFSVCLITLPVLQTLIYNVPCLVCGYIIGKQQTKKNKLANIFFLFVINTIFIIYEFILSNILLSTNLFLAYQDSMTATLTSVLKINIDHLILNYILIVFLLLDSVFSSIIIYMLSNFIISKVNDAIRKK